MDSAIEQFRHSLRVRIFNRVGAILSRAGISIINLSEESLLRAARHQTGLSNWEDDFSRVALRALLDSYEREANLSSLGRVIVRRECIRLLSNRLRIHEDLKRHPEILDVPIRRPLFIIGFPRTGTTLLHNLLAQDPAARVPLMWELHQPSPPPTRETRDSDPRIKIAERRVKGILELAPQVFSIHPLNPTGPDECIHLFKNGFASIAFSLSGDVPRYVEWLCHQDMIPAYKYYRRQLQLLQWRCPGEHWVLKSPSHLLSLDALLAVFPDACLIHTHRDPLKVVASFCSLVSMVRKMNSNQVDLKHLGESCLSLLGESMDRAMKVRESTHDAQFYDVDYEDLIADPISMVHRIYKYFGYHMDPRMESGMKRFLSANQQHKHGKHLYSLDQFGLDQNTVSLRFASYVERFNIQPE